MRFVSLIAFIVFISGGAARLHAADTNVVIVPKVAITNLLAHKQEYIGKRVEVAGYYAGSFEHYILYETKAKRDPDKSLWIDLFDEAPLYKQRLGRGTPADFRGKVRIIGTFEYRPGGRSGHMGACPARITKLELFEEVE